MEFREARLEDADAIAALHVENWRRHYRGAYLDSYLDGDVVGDRQSVWRDRLAHPAYRHTVVAAEDHTLAGFVHLIIDDDPTWGALVENLHVADVRKRRGVGGRLLAEAAAFLGQQRQSSGLYLWVLEQNTAAQAFYAACDGVVVERKMRGPFPGGGTAIGLRIWWPDPAVLVRPHAPRREHGEVTIRPAVASDLDRLLSLYQQLAGPGAEPADKQPAIRRFEDIARQPHRSVLVGEWHDEVLGTADLLVVPNLTHGGKPWAIVEHVIVDQTVRRCGIGRALMNEIFRRCDEAGCYKIQLLSRTERHEAHAFYANVGFDISAEGFRRYRT
jgi:GNAT superfamily N-acetyltransferase